MKPPWKVDISNNDYLYSTTAISSSICWHNGYLVVGQTGGVTPCHNIIFEHVTYSSQ